MPKKKNPPFILTFHYVQVVGRFCNSHIRGSKEITGISISLVQSKEAINNFAVDTTINICTSTTHKLPVFFQATQNLLCIKKTQEYIMFSQLFLKHLEGP